MLFSKYFGDKISYGSSIGLAYNIVYRTNTVIRFNTNNGVVEETYTSARNNPDQFVSALFAVGIAYHFNNLAFSFEPNLGYQLFGINNSYNKYWHIGLGVSASYRIQ